MKANSITYFLFPLLLIGYISCDAQDTIVKRDGQQLIGKILEVSPQEIRYKKIEFPDGPVYIEEKSNVEQIKYSGGYVDKFEEVKKEVKTAVVITKKSEDDYRRLVQNYKIVKVGGSYYKQNDNFLSERQMQDVLLKVNDAKITYMVEKARLGKGLRYMGFAAIPIFMGSVIATSMSSVSYSSSSTRNSLNILVGGTVVSGIVLGTSIYLNIDYRVKNSQAIRLYNEKYAN